MPLKHADHTLIPHLPPLSHTAGQNEYLKRKLQNRTQELLPARSNTLSHPSQSAGPQRIIADNDTRMTVRPIDTMNLDHVDLHSDVKNLNYKDGKFSIKSETKSSLQQPIKSTFDDHTLLSLDDSEQLDADEQTAILRTDQDFENKIRTSDGMQSLRAKDWKHSLNNHRSQLGWQHGQTPIANSRTEAREWFDNSHDQYRTAKKAAEVGLRRDEVRVDTSIENEDVTGTAEGSPSKFKPLQLRQKVYQAASGNSSPSFDSRLMEHAEREHGPNKVNVNKINDTGFFTKPQIPLEYVTQRNAHGNPVRTIRVQVDSRTTSEISQDSDYQPSIDEDVGSSVAGENPVLENGRMHQNQQISDLDFDPDKLHSMSFEQLRREEFTVDPRNIETKTSKVEEDLSDRLSNLQNLNDEDQRQLFRKQTDTEWSQTGTWFIEEIQKDLAKLVAARLERRKVSIKFENEIRRRQKEVEWCIDNVEEELAGLKRGGNHLIKHRKPCTQLDTPRK